MAIDANEIKNAIEGTKQSLASLFGVEQPTSTANNFSIERKTKASNSVDRSKIPTTGKTVTNVDASGINANSMNNYWDNYETFFNRMHDAAKNNPAFNLNKYLPGGDAESNINAKSREESLRLSRLADALNNQYFRSPRSTGAQVATKGGGISGEGPNQGNLYQMPMTTEEMRQMERARGYEAQVRGREIGRQQGVQDTNLEQMRSRFEEMLRRSGQLNDEQIRRAMEIWEYSLDYEKMYRNEEFNRARMVFEQELSRLEIPSRQANIIMDYAMGDSELANIFAVLFGVGQGAPTRERILYSQAAANELQRVQALGGTTNDAIEAINRLNVRFGSEYLQQTLGEGWTELQSLIDRARGGK